MSRKSTTGGEKKERKLCNKCATEKETTKNKIYLKKDAKRKQYKKGNNEK